MTDLDLDTLQAAASGEWTATVEMPAPTVLALIAELRDSRARLAEVEAERDGLADLRAAMEHVKQLPAGHTDEWSPREHLGHHVIFAVMDRALTEATARAEAAEGGLAEWQHNHAQALERIDAWAERGNRLLARAEAAEQKVAALAEVIERIANLAAEHLNCSGCPTPWWLTQELHRAIIPADPAPPAEAEIGLLIAEAIRDAARDWFEGNGSRACDEDDRHWFMVRALRIEEQWACAAAPSPSAEAEEVTAICEHGYFGPHQTPLLADDMPDGSTRHAGWTTCPGPTPPTTDAEEARDA